MPAAPSRSSPSSEHASNLSSSTHSEDDGDEDNDSEGASSGDNLGNMANHSGHNNNLMIGGGLKSPTLFMMDEKTPTTNTLLSAAQGTARFPSQTDPYLAHAAIRNRRNGSIPSATAPTLAGDNPPLISAPSNSSSPQLQQQQPYISPSPHQPLSIRQLPNFPSIDEALGPSASSSASSPHGLAAREVWRWFEDHLDGLLESVRAFRFDQFEIHLRTFWASLSGDHREVVHAPAVAGLMAKADALLYDVRVILFE